jgi:hypothetical protein
MANEWVRMANECPESFSTGWNRKRDMPIDQLEYMRTVVAFAFFRLSIPSEVTS